MVPCVSTIAELVLPVCEYGTTVKVVTQGIERSSFPMYEGPVVVWFGEFVALLGPSTGELLYKVAK